MGFVKASSAVKQFAPCRPGATAFDLSTLVMISFCISLLLPRHFLTRTSKRTTRCRENNLYSRQSDIFLLGPGSDVAMGEYVSQRCVVEARLHDHREKRTV